MAKKNSIQELYEKEIAKVWGNDQEMIKYCIKSVAAVIEHGGRLYTIEKPKIKTVFCFGYGLSGVSTEEDMRKADRAADNILRAENFISANKRPIEKTIEHLSEARDGKGYMSVFTLRNAYNRQPSDCLLSDWCLERWTKTGENADPELIDKLIQSYREILLSFEKRLNRYIKRFGTSKIRSYSYLVD